MPTAFVIRPFKVKKDSAGAVLDFDRVHTALIQPAIEASGLEGGDTGELVEPGNIREDMFARILEADLVICDITIPNANVFYELGIRHALRKKRTVLLKGGPTADSTPFDILTDRYVAYDVADPAAAKADLLEVIHAALVSMRETDSPIFKMLPALHEADPRTVLVVPPDFREEVARAKAARSKGWLRLLAHEVEGRRFERSGLQLVGEALQKLGDLERARQTFERIIQLAPDDVSANLALASTYERLYRVGRAPQTLSDSDLALDRVLANAQADVPSRVEALALKGRNNKTRWREQFQDLPDEPARRAAAMNQLLRDAYSAYRQAFEQDLNHFYSGIAALQMGVMFLELSSGADGEWRQSFDTDAEADEFRADTAAQVESLRAVVTASTEAALRRLKPGDNDYLWANVTKTDLLFLAGNGVQRIVNRYKDAIPVEDAFAWNAVQGQLGLFASLGVKGDLARGIIAAMQAVRPTADAAQAERPVHAVIFAGHRVDPPGRERPRFPPALEPEVQQAIAAAIQGIGDDHRVLGLASAAPGGDLVFHEVCGRLKIDTTICLPMPQDEYVDTVFDDLGWRARFLKLLQERKERRAGAILELSNRSGLPGWLEGAPTNPWERGNRWVFEMACTSGAARITLVTLWDGNEQGDGPGGTAHMVRLARAVADVDIVRIDPAALGKPAQV